MINPLLQKPRVKSRGQAMTEFLIALPILLFVLFGIIEFARLTFAWMAVQNSARFGLRYAVTGEFNEIYCVQAGDYLGSDHVDADVDGGDPQDCRIPDSYTASDKGDLERELIDLARLYSIQDAASGGGSGLWINPSVSGDYEQYLQNHDMSFVGQPHEEGFFHVTICSSRDNRFGFLDPNPSDAVDLIICQDTLNSELMDDAGGPGDRVKVYVKHRHPLFLPLLSNIWPSVDLDATREGVVEQFRTSKDIGVTGPVGGGSVWTSTPTITYTPSKTPSPIPTDTPTPLPTPFTCAGSGILRENWYGISGSNLGNLTGHPDYPSSPHDFAVDAIFDAPVNWKDSYGTRMRAWLCIPSIGEYRFWIASDDNSKLLLDCSGTDPNAPGDANPGAASMIASESSWAGHLDFDKHDSQESSLINIDKIGWVCYIEALQKEGWGGDNLTVAWQIPFSGTRNIISGQYLLPLSSNPTALPSPTPTATATPDCSKYSMTDFSFSKWAMQQLTVSNNDIVDTDVNRIQLFWDYAEDLGVASGYSNLNIDWFQWGGKNFGGIGRDYSSSTTANDDENFNAGGNYTLKVDFDADWGDGGRLTNVISDDFGVVIDFENGCQLSRNAIPRSMATLTATLTPTTTYTATASLVPTATQTFSATPTSSNTPTSSMTPTSSNTPTSTDVPPTATFTATSTNTPYVPPTFTPVNTPVPPTATDTVAPTETETPIPSWTPRCGFDHPDFPCQPSWTPTP